MNSNSKRTNKPTEDADALAQFDRLRAILTETHTEIPQLLARERDLNRTAGLDDTEESRRGLEDVIQRRQIASRRRGSALEAILALEGPLQAEKAAVERSRQEYASTAVAAFSERYSAAVSALQALWQEGRVLSETLKVQVPMVLPVKVVTSPVDGIPRALPVLADIAVTLDAEAGRLGAEADKLDAALSLVGGIRQSREMDSRHRRLCAERRTSPVMSQLYEVVKPVTHLGMTFERGTLIDQSLIGVGALYRNLVGRCILEAADQPVVAA